MVNLDTPTPSDGRGSDRDDSRVLFEAILHRRLQRTKTFRVVGHEIPYAPQTDAQILSGRHGSGVVGGRRFWFVRNGVCLSGVACLFVRSGVLSVLSGIVEEVLVWSGTVVW